VVAIGERAAAADRDQTRVALLGQDHVRITSGSRQVRRNARDCRRLRVIPGRQARECRQSRIMGAAQRASQSIRCARATMMPSGPRTYAIRHMFSY
jgi:hypothetical protein